MERVVPLEAGRGREIRVRHGAFDIALFCSVVAIGCAVTSVTFFAEAANTSAIWMLTAITVGVFAIWHIIGCLWETILTPDGLIQRRMGQTMLELPWKDVQRAQRMSGLRIRVETWSGLVMSVLLPFDASPIAEMMEVGLCRKLGGNRAGSKREGWAKRRWRALVHGWDSVIEYGTPYVHASGCRELQLNPFQERLTEAIKLLIPFSVCYFALKLWGWGPALFVAFLMSLLIAKILRSYWMPPLYDGEIELLPGVVRFHQSDGGFVDLPFTGWNPQQRWITAIQEFEGQNCKFRVDLASLITSEPR